MAQQLQRWRSAGGEKSWLSMLIATMEDVSRPEPHSQPCDRSVVAAVRAQLSRPAALHARQGFGLRH
ncbi:MAG: transcriptional regulator [Bradyrhizobium sp.]|uniref:transcriptional regulator n=1 Tax=Bradyrhizobium sp. TaxID=376 RepID=UPI00271B41B9|nr:transcriptional regulator [Bradyrhizobium sp.]MDO9564726.1 transcriptional regulator [Bradyrhizobium sp.]MDP3694135.1 transcriptional regulator [Bradyrhizobium sp.]